MPSSLTIWACLIAATAFETTGDAVVRIGLFERAGAARVGVVLGGGFMLLLYGVMLNLAPLPFSRVAGLYIATLFVMWQVVAFAAFRAVPTPPILIGGALIIAGGLIVSFWGDGAAGVNGGIDGFRVVGRSYPAGRPFSSKPARRRA